MGEEIEHHFKDMFLPRPDGIEVPIKLLGPDKVATPGSKPSPNLGVFICPSGNMKLEFDRQQDISLEMAEKNRTSVMT